MREREGTAAETGQRTLGGAGARAQRSLWASDWASTKLLTRSNRAKEASDGGGITGGKHAAPSAVGGTATTALGRALPRRRGRGPRGADAGSADPFPGRGSSIRTVHLI